MSALARWQVLHHLTDHEAADQLGLEIKEYCRQRATRPSRHTALLAIHRAFPAQHCGDRRDRGQPQPQARIQCALVAPHRLHHGGRNQYIVIGA
jgi:hypothetical protein